MLIKKVLICIGIMLNKIPSFIMNILYWIFHIKSIFGCIRYKKTLKQKITNINDVKKEIKKFIWHKEKIDWIPWVITVICENFIDDCDGAAVYGKYLFKCANIPASICFMFNSFKDGHAVAITDDKKYMISNNIFYEFKNISDEKSYEEEILTKAIPGIRFSILIKQN